MEAGLVTRSPILDNTEHLYAITKEGAKALAEIYEKLMNKDEAKANKPLTETQIRLLELIRDKPGSGVRDAMSELGLAEQTAANNLRELANLRLATPKMTGKTNHYKISRKGLKELDKALTPTPAPSPP